MPYADENKNRECRRRSYWKHRTERLAYHKMRKDRSKELVYRIWEECWQEGKSRYGDERGGCVCCHERRDSLLTVDHINGRELHEKKNSNYTGKKKLMRHLRTQGWPSGYQILCLNCNFSRSLTLDGRCEHERERDDKECDA